MKQTNIIEENQILKNDIEFFRQKFMKAKKENQRLMKEIVDLKKNLDNF
jgi:hypothetical protein